MVFLLIKFSAETTYQWITVTQPFIATNPFSSFVVPAPGMAVSENSVNTCSGYAATDHSGK